MSSQAVLLKPKIYSTDDLILKVVCPELTLNILNIIEQKWL